MDAGYFSKPAVENQCYLRRQYFPSKAGGVPAWLDPLNIPSGKASLCDICGDPLRFLLQVYAPICKKESAFHRMLFVFVCPSMTCLLRDQHEQKRICHPPERPASRSVKVFRCQLPRYNPFYSSEPPQVDGSQGSAGSGAALCDWCGTWKGDKLCSGRRQEQYCSEKHQVLSWHLGHEIACQKIKVSSPVCEPNISGTTSLESHKVGSTTYMWPEFEIIVKNEIEDDSYIFEDCDPSEDDTLPNSLILRNGIDDPMISLLDCFQGGDNRRSLAYFQELIAYPPHGQVLRYYRNTGAKPNWPVSGGLLPFDADIPNCTYCGGPMSCEFQVLPQLRYYIKVDNEVDSLHWDSIVVYACEASCEASLPYKQEYAWVLLSS